MCAVSGDHEDVTTLLCDYGAHVRVWISTKPLSRIIYIPSERANERTSERASCEGKRIAREEPPSHVAAIRTVVYVYQN